MCKCGYCPDETPCSPASKSGVWHASNLTPPTFHRRRLTRKEGIIPMTMEKRCCEVFPKTLQRRHRWKIPPCRSCRQNGTEGDFRCLNSTQQRPNVFLSDAWLAPATYHGRVVNTTTRVWVRAPHQRVPLTFNGAVVRFVHRRQSQTRNLAVSNYHFADCFLGRLGSTYAHGVFPLFVFQVWNLFVEHQWSCLPRPHSVDYSGSAGK